MLLITASLFHLVYLKSFPCLSSQQKGRNLSQEGKVSKHFVQTWDFFLDFDNHETLPDTCTKNLTLSICSKRELSSKCLPEVSKSR